MYISVLLNKLIDEVNSADLIKQSDFSLLKIDIRGHCLKELLNQLNAQNSFYFKDKNDETEILAINKTIEVSDVVLSLRDNPEAIIMSAERFSEQERIHSTWDSVTLGNFYYKFTFIKEGPSTLCYVIVNHDFTNEDKYELIHELYDLFTQKAHYDDNNHIISSVQNPQYSEWEEMLQKSTTLLNNGKLEKIVLNRNIEQKYSKKIDPYNIFTSLLRNKKDNYEVFIKLNENTYFLSITPERLLKVDAGSIEIDSLAGSAKRSPNELEDNRFANALLTDIKEVNEHQIVTDSILESLRKFTTKTEIVSRNKILKLKHIQHIHTKIIAHIENKNIFKLKSELHPTPAVGGYPKGIAIEEIKNIEPYARGLYAAPIGYYSKNKTEICVGIRSALIFDKSITIFGGCGIVKGSLALNEWIETENKMKNFSEFLGQNE